MADQFFSFDNADGGLQGRKNSSPLWKKHELKIKFMHRGLEKGKSAAGLLRQFPGCFPQWGNCLFSFTNDDRDYDWLVVYQDLPPSNAGFTEERLCCARERSLLITGEPSSITVFGTDYLRQFGCILSFQEPWAMRHDNVVYHHPGLIWYYGLPFSRGKFITWDDLKGASPVKKGKLISTVCSQRTGKATLHDSRVGFVGALKRDIEELDVFGHGVLPINDKAEALDQYRFHIVIENHIHPHHITEKLPDAFLGFTLPFYHGAPNCSEYFPADSFIPIDINNYRRTREIIRYHIDNDEYEDRLPYIIEARRRVLEEENLFAILQRVINQQEDKITTETMGKIIRNRHTMRLKNPLAGIRSLTEKTAIMAYHRFMNKNN